jgi:hypothetical protein
MLTMGMSRATRVAYGVALTASLLPIGATVGGAINVLGAPSRRSLDGQIAALGGLMIGLVLGAAVGIVLARLLVPRWLRATTIVSVGLALSLVTFAAYRIRSRLPAPEPPRILVPTETPPEPPAPPGG